MSTATSGSITLLTAQEAALSHDDRIDTLGLDPIRKGIPTLPVARSIIGARVSLTIEGAATLTLRIHDPKWVIERSELLQVGVDGRLTAIRVTVDALAFRLVKVSRVEPTVLELTFEDEVVALLRRHNKPLAASRNSMTRAQFIESLIREVKARDIPFFAPEKGRKPPTALPDYPNSRPAGGQTGFDDGTKLKIKGVVADAQQMRELATILTVADQEDAKGRARIAEVVAAIGESSVRAIPNAAGSGYEGVFQADPEKIPRRDTALQARYFLLGGRGFQAGGAIKAARDNPDWSPGEIALNVEGSRSNFPTYAQGIDFYERHRKEADAIIAAWGGGTGGQDSSVLRVKSYQFTRGQGGKRETSWDAMTRLAEEVQWRVFAMGGIVWFVSDDFLISKPASLVIEDIDDEGLLQPPVYDWDEGKTVQTVELTAAASRWGVHPGSVVALRDMGPVTGRWIVQTVDIDLLNATDVGITMVKPLPPKKEPSAEIVSQQKKKDSKTSGGVPASGTDKLSYPLATHGQDLGGVAAHRSRAWGNWQSDNAVDIGCPLGTAVFAVDHGTIERLGGQWDGTGLSNPNGFNVTIRTRDNAWFYTHLRYRKPSLKVGDKVSRGEFLGGSGAANGVKHLHIACEHGDPEQLLGVKR